MIGSLTSTTIKDSVSYYHRYFPQESYDCIVGLVGLMGPITDAVVRQEDAERQSMVGSITGITQRQSMLVALLSASYPAVLAGPEASWDQSKNFSAMKTFAEWDKENSQHGLSITLTKSMWDEVTTLQGHILVRLAGHPKATDLCIKIVGAAMDFWEAYVPMFTLFYQKLLAKVCEGGKCLKSLQWSYWGVTTGCFM